MQDTMIHYQRHLALNERAREMALDIIADLTAYPESTRAFVAGRLLLSGNNQLQVAAMIYDHLGVHQESPRHFELHPFDGANVSSYEHVKLLAPLTERTFDLVEKLRVSSRTYSCNRQPLLDWRVRELNKRCDSAFHTSLGKIGVDNLDQEAESLMPHPARFLAQALYALDLWVLFGSATEYFRPKAPSYDLPHITQLAEMLQAVVGNDCALEAYRLAYLQAVTGFFEDLWQAAADEVFAAGTAS